MFLLTVFVYPIVLALMCVGMGLLLDRATGGMLPAALLPACGLAALIGVTQLTTSQAWLAPASPYVAAAIALGGLVLQRDSLRSLALSCAWRAGARWPLLVMTLVYLIAIAPVMLSGRPSFSAYMTLTDSAVHIVGADYLIHHGRSFAHLDLRNSYGQFVNSYFNTGYPSGADTAFGASALLLRLPLIWTFQPFNAFALACAVGPIWLLLRRAGLRGAWLAVAALSSSLPALVYAYELIASVKEIVALPIVLSLGALVVTHSRWMPGRARNGIPFGILLAGGVSALGAGFGAWALVSFVVLAAIAQRLVAARAWTWRGVLAMLLASALSALVFAAPTWANVSGSLAVTSSIAETSNPGNLQSPLRAVQMLGTWLSNSYMSAPVGGRDLLTDLLVGLTALAASIGIVAILRARRWALGGWLAGSFAVWLALSAYGTTWVNAKGLMLTSPVVLVLAWAGVGALRSGLRSERPAPAAASPAYVPFAATGPGVHGRWSTVLATLLAVAIGGGVLLSDAIQYRASPLAPTARYEEMASLGSRFRGRGPTLFADFDEYSLYELRSLDVGGPDFLYPPHGLYGASEGHGYSVDLQRTAPAELARYPLIVTRRNPAAYRPPAAYRLLWQGSYYEVWGRRKGVRPAIAVTPLHGAHPVQCDVVSKIADTAREHHATLVADTHPDLRSLSLASLHHTAGFWRHGVELEMDGEGRLWTTFAVAKGGEYELWLSGEAMPTLGVHVDGRLVGEVGGQLSGNGDSPDPMLPLKVRLTAGRNRLSIARGGFSLAPGSGAPAYLEAILITPTGAEAAQHLRYVSPSHWHSLCGRHLDWIEAVPR